MNSNTAPDRQTLLPPPEQKDLDEMLKMFELLMEIEPEETQKDQANFSLRADEAHQDFSLESLQQTFSVLGEKGIEMPSVLPPSGEEQGE